MKKHFRIAAAMFMIMIYCLSGAAGVLASAESAAPDAAKDQKSGPRTAVRTCPDPSSIITKNAPDVNAGFVPRRCRYFYGRYRK